MKQLLSSAELAESCPVSRLFESQHEPVSKYYASMKLLGIMKLSFLSPLKPAKWDLLGLFWVCWRIIFPCAVVGREKAENSAAKSTWAEPNWRNSSLLECSVIPDDTMVCLLPSLWLYSTGQERQRCLFLSWAACLFLKFLLLMALWALQTPHHLFVTRLTVQH